MSTRTEVIKNGSNGLQTVLFLPDLHREMPTGRNIKSRIWQIFPVCIGSLTCIPYGLMLGWPSPTYPKLLAESTPIFITIDQSAMIAGFLMIGNILGTPLSVWSRLGSKYGFMLGSFGMLVGWLVMWYATNIYFLLASRLLVGLGCGYGMGQLKTYIKELCVPDLAQLLLKLLNFYVFFGVIAAFILGTFVSFTDFSLVIVVVTAVIFLLCFLLPHSPKEYLRFGKIQQARTVVRFVKPEADVDEEIQQLKAALGAPMEHMSFFQVLRDRVLRKNFAILGLLTFFQQFSGAPATIIYTQIIFTASGSPYPEFCAIAYASLFFGSNLVGLFYCKTLNRRNCLLFSSISVTLALILNIIVMHFNFNEKYWSYTFLVTMFIFIFLHTAGLGVVPFMLTQEYFPERARRIVSHFQIMQHSALGLIITKIFQVLYDRFALYVPFCLFLCMSLIGSFFVLIFVPHKPPVLSQNIKKLRRSVLV